MKKAIKIVKMAVSVGAYLACCAGAGVSLGTIFNIVDSE